MRLRLFIVAVASIAIALVMAILLGTAGAETTICGPVQTNNNPGDVIHFWIEYNIGSNFSVRIDPSSDTSTYIQEGSWQSGSLFHYDVALVAPSSNQTIQIFQTGGSFRRSSCNMGITSIDRVQPCCQSSNGHWPVDEEGKAVFRMWEQDAINWGEGYKRAFIVTGTLALVPGFAVYVAPWQGLLGVMAGSTAIQQSKYHDLAIDPEDQNCYEVYDPPVLSIDELNSRYGTAMYYSDGTDPDGSGVLPWYQNNIVEVIKGMERKLEGAYGSMNRGLTCNVDWQFNVAAQYLSQAGDDAATLSAWHSNLRNYMYVAPEVDSILGDVADWYQRVANELHAR